MTTIVKAADAAQFLSLVPRMLGCRPTRSVVLIPFDGSRSIGALRFDLPATEDPEELDRIAATLIGTVCRIPDADAVAVVVYADEPFGAGGPRRDVVEALAERADECGLRLTDALCVGADAWGSVLDADLPPGGRMLDELAPPDGAAHLDIPDGDQTVGADLPETDPAERERVARALSALGDAVRLVCGPEEPRRGASTRDRPRQNGKSRRPGTRDAEPERALADDPAQDGTTSPIRVDPLALEALCLLDDLPCLFEEALEWPADALGAYDAAVLVWCLSRPALRDIALVGWCGGLSAGDDALDAQLKWEAGAEYPAHLAMHMWGEGDRPDPERLEAALALARRASAVAPPEHRAGPLATAGWLAWALGRSTHADLYARQACELDPEHGLAEIVRSFVAAGHLPDWAFRRG